MFNTFSESNHKNFISCYVGVVVTFDKDILDVHARAMSSSHPSIHSCWVCCREESSEIDVAGGLYVLFGSGKLESIYSFHSRLPPVFLPF